MLVSKPSISSLAQKAQIEEMREGEWVLMLQPKPGGGSQGWVDHFLKLIDHEDETRPMLEWVERSLPKELGSVRKNGTFSMQLEHVTQVTLGLPDYVSPATAKITIPCALLLLLLNLSAPSTLLT